MKHLLVSYIMLCVANATIIHGGEETLCHSSLLMTSHKARCCLQCCFLFIQISLSVVMFKIYIHVVAWVKRWINFDFTLETSLKQLTHRRRGVWIIALLNSPVSLHIVFLCSLWHPVTSVFSVCCPRLSYSPVFPVRSSRVV